MQGNNPSLKSKFKYVPLEQDSRDEQTTCLVAYNQTVQNKQVYWIEANLTQWYLWSQKPGRGNWVCKVKKIYGVALRIMVMVCGSTYWRSTFEKCIYKHSQEHEFICTLTHTHAHKYTILRIQHYLLWKSPKLFSFCSE